jgi:hypothetical protein
MNTNTQRYEVVAEYPKCTVSKGQILNAETPEEKAWCDKYPHLFRLLKWWEGLAVDELPKYVKWQADDKIWVCKVEMYSVEHDDTYIYAYIGNRRSIDKLLLNDNDHPATEAEYNDYLTKLNGK